MNQPSVTSGKPATRAPVFFWITITLLALLLLAGTAGALWLVFEAKNINRSGGWGWLLVGAIYVVATTVVCALCAGCAAASLFRKEPHRMLSTVILVISGFVVLVFGPVLIRTVHSLRHEHDLAARASENAPQPPAAALPQSSVSPSTEGNSTAPVRRASEDQQILELKSKLWEAIRARNVDAFVDCFFIEARFDTPEIRQENRTQVEILLRGETVDVEVRDIPSRELVEIMKIQNAKPARLVRYSLLPRKMLRIQQEGLNGRVGRSFLIGEKNGQWYIITLAGHTT